MDVTLKEVEREAYLNHVEAVRFLHGDNNVSLRVHGDTTLAIELSIYKEQVVAVKLFGESTTTKYMVSEFYEA
jgi:hypothetical protein